MLPAHLQVLRLDHLARALEVPHEVPDSPQLCGPYRHCRTDYQCPLQLSAAEVLTGALQREFLAASGGNG